MDTGTISDLGSGNYDAFIQGIYQVKKYSAMVLSVQDFSLKYFLRFKLFMNRSSQAENKLGLTVEG